jgi:hypothetical protein
MATATDHTFEIFGEAILEEDGNGYPDQLTFVPTDIEGWELMVWRNMLRRMPTNVVDENACEILFVPLDRSRALAWVDRRRGRVRASVTWRRAGALRGCPRAVSLSRKRLVNLEFRPGMARA